MSKQKKDKDYSQVAGNIVDWVGGKENIQSLTHCVTRLRIAKMNDFWDPMDAATKNIWDGADVKKELDGADKAILAK